MTAALLSAAGVTKHYPGAVALEDAQIELRAHEIHAILGENGSGKSTLLSIVAGALRPDQGRIAVAGATYESLDPVLARSLGIALVPQEPQLAPALSVGENIMMGQWPVRAGLVRWRDIHAAAQGLLDRFGLSLNSRDIVSSLSVGRRQLVEIAKALITKPQILLLDEATSSLGEAETARLTSLLQVLKADGAAIGFVSHRMKEVMALADRVTILRDGKFIATTRIEETSERKLVSLMVGRNLDSYWHKAKLTPGAPLLEVSGVSRGSLSDISLTVHEREIVGLAGLVGSGRSAIMRTLMGIKPQTSGTISIRGRPARIGSPRNAHRLGLGYVPENRKSEGLVMDWPVSRNAALSVMNERRGLSLLGRRFDLAALETGSAGLKIRASSPAQPVKQLSGGNQQKVVIARELATHPHVLLLDEPTRGIDVGAKEDIYARLATLVTGGMGLLVASSELPELLGICDRIYVLFCGRIVAELPASEASEDSIIYWASGAHEISQAGRA